MGALTIGVSAGGSGFTSLPTITSTGGGTETALMGVNTIGVSAGGSGYTSVPTVSFSGTVSGGAASATASLGVGFDFGDRRRLRIYFASDRERPGRHHECDSYGHAGDGLAKRDCGRVWLYRNANGGLFWRQWFGRGGDPGGWSVFDFSSSTDRTKRNCIHWL